MSEAMAENAEVEEQVIEAAEGAAEEIVAAESDANVELEIVDPSAGDTPPSETGLPIGIVKRMSRLRGKVEAESADEIAAAKAKAEQLENENRLLRHQLTSNVEPQKIPDELDYDDRAQYLAAMDSYNSNRMTEIVRKEAQKLAGDNNSRAQQEAGDKALADDLSSHYARAETLRMGDKYVELEGKAMDIIGDDFARVLMQSTDNSHLILASLGANTAKAQELVNILNSGSPSAAAKALTSAVLYGASLTTKPKNSTPAPDPEEKTPAGSGVMKYDDGPAGATYR